MWCWVILPFYDYCSFWYVTVINIMDELLFFYIYICCFIANCSTFIVFTVWRSIMHQHTKFCWNQSDCFLAYHDFFYFQDGDQLPSWIIKIAKFYRARQLYKNISMLFLFPVKDGKLSTGVNTTFSIVLRLVFNNQKLPYKTTCINSTSITQPTLSFYLCVKM